MHNPKWEGWGRIWSQEALEVCLRRLYSATKTTNKFALLDDDVSDPEIEEAAPPKEKKEKVQTPQQKKRKKVFKKPYILRLKISLLLMMLDPSANLTALPASSVVVEGEQDLSAWWLRGLPRQGRPRWRDCCTWQRFSPRQGPGQP